jgi:hypothetical protein
MTDTDEFTDDDIQHVKQLEAFMRERGYRRERYGFWRMPSAEMTLPEIEHVEEDED